MYCTVFDPSLSQANVMLEYPIDEAEQMLMKNLSNAKRSLTVVDEDLEFITDQCTTLEVGILHYKIILYYCCIYWILIEKCISFLNQYLLSHDKSLQLGRQK